MNTVIAGPSAEDVGRADDLARIIRVFSGQLGLSGHLIAWTGGSGPEAVMADLETLASTVAQLRDLVAGGAR